MKNTFYGSATLFFEWFFAFTYSIFWSGYQPKGLILMTVIFFLIWHNLLHVH